MTDIGDETSRTTRRVIIPTARVTDANNAGSCGLSFHQRAREKAAQQAQEKAALGAQEKEAARLAKAAADAEKVFVPTQAPKRKQSTTEGVEVDDEDDSTAYRRRSPKAPRVLDTCDEPSSPPSASSPLSSSQSLSSLSSSPQSTSSSNSSQGR
ncbi:hypothetical protein HGRIS_001118 [Hohenbuehelia grisea]|uniref:Uncharacterized protein n=1 Tax=Hohenbuehelia grisea TaxID=104357 RepID=A0ABR3JNW9_9AGAR